jgi:hypothetical protein
VADLKRSAKKNVDARLRTFLWRSGEVRSLLKKEVLRILTFIAVYLVTIVCVRYFTVRSISEGLIGGIVGAFTIFLIWLVAVVRTIRQVLREHSLL